MHERELELRGGHSEMVPMLKQSNKFEKIKYIVTFFYGGNLRKQFYSTILKFYRHTTTGFLAK